VPKAPLFFVRRETSWPKCFDTASIVGLAPGVPAAVMVKLSLTVAPLTAETPLPAAPVVPQPVDGVMFEAARAVPLIDPRMNGPLRWRSTFSGQAC